MDMDVKNLLLAVKRGEMTVEQAEEKLKTQPFIDMGFAKIDAHRPLRQGVNEVIYGEGKTAKEIETIVKKMLSIGQNKILVTRLSAEKASAIEGVKDFVYHERARIATIGGNNSVRSGGTIVVASGGTSDFPVAEEAAITAEFLGNRVERLYDVGVAGLHRLLNNLQPLMNASVVIAVAGMEGALASVIGGLVDCPIIAVPTSVGYGANFEGLSALLAMLNSCASGVGVVNIDNGFGAGFLASRINQPKTKEN